MVVYKAGVTISAVVTVSPFGPSTAYAAALTAPDGTLSAPTITPIVDHSQATCVFVATDAGQWTLVVTVTGTGAGVQTSTYDVQGIPPPSLANSYATTQDYADYFPGETLPSGLVNLLRRASYDVDGIILCAIYDPTDTAILATLAEATCEQVAYLVAQGLDQGIVGGYQSVSIGSVSLDRGQRGGAMGGATGVYVRPFSPDAFRLLQLSGLTAQAPIAGL